MLAGIIDGDNYSSVLRDIAKQRRHGVLGLRFSDHYSDLFFIQGKIVDIKIEGQDRSAQVENGLVELGLLSAAKGVGSYLELWGALEASGQATARREIFIRLVEIAIMDSLLQIKWAAGALFEFKVQSLQVEKDIYPTISVGQLLLDLAAIETTSDRFGQLFPSNVVIASLGNDVADQEFNQTQARILSCLDQPKNLARLKLEALLNDSQLQEALLDLYDRAAIKVERADCSDNLDDNNSDLNKVETRQPREYEDSDPDRVSTEAPSWLALLNSYLINATWLTILVLVLFIFSAIYFPLQIWSARGLAVPAIIESQALP